MASRVKVVKWFLVGSLCLFCSVSLVRGQDAASTLFNNGINALNNGQFDDAAKDFRFSTRPKDRPRSICRAATKEGRHADRCNH